MAVWSDSSSLTTARNRSEETTAPGGAQRAAQVDFPEPAGPQSTTNPRSGDVWGAMGYEFGIAETVMGAGHCDAALQGYQAGVTLVRGAGPPRFWALMPLPYSEPATARRRSGAENNQVMSASGAGWRSACGERGAAIGRRRIDAPAALDPPRVGPVPCTPVE